MKFNKILLFEGKDNDNVSKARDDIENWAEDNGIKLRSFSEISDLTARVEGSEPDPLVLSLGGDGTFLRAADMVSSFKLPILGINLGRLGFLSGLDCTELVRGLTSVCNGEFTIDELSRLKCQINHADLKKSKDYTALNEVVVSRGDVSSFAEVELYLDSTRVATYPGDGVIVATPTGSTAYSLSSGGPLITRNTPALTITPLNVHQLGLIPIICSEESEITLVAKTEVVIQVDGNRVGRLPPGQDVKITKSPVPTLMVVPDIRSGFFETVRNKLNWGLNRGT
ncbi:NAD(+)/NADH kinase [Candidatus Bipolaricaulota bacterium]|nr:NAD(+)/NADH kinase [Candidatus Bipolaricaulota bacterium]